MFVAPVEAVSFTWEALAALLERCPNLTAILDESSTRVMGSAAIPPALLAHRDRVLRAPGPSSPAAVTADLTRLIDKAECIVLLGA